MKTVPADEPAAIPGSPDEHRNRTHLTNFTLTLDLMEFLQPANDNIDAVSVVLDVVYKLRVAHYCRAVLVFIHRQCVNKS